MLKIRTVNTVLTFDCTSFSQGQIKTKLCVRPFPAGFSKLTFHLITEQQAKLTLAIFAFPEKNNA